MKEQSRVYSTPLLGMSFLVSLLTLYYSFSSWQWHWFARSGAFITVVGIIMTGTQLVESGWRFRAFINGWKGSGDSPFAPVYEEEDLRWLSDYIGFWLLIAGTIIWGFGDLPNVLWPVKPY